MRSAFVGFDSAWGGRTPGGVCCATFDDNSLAIRLPEPADFDHAKSVIEKCREDADYTLVALDQPTMVPNRTGMRPVERVAGAVKLGVQPANLGSAMFDQSAPIWAFLDDLNPSEEPHKAQRATQGLHVVEVFPGLALSALSPVPKLPWTFRYNPKNPGFSIADWRLVARSTLAQAKRLQLGPFVDWVAEQAGKTKPSKEDQDCLDALLCLIVALKWRRQDADTEVLGDWRGYMVTPLSKDGHDRVACRAPGLNVPVGAGSWQVFETVLRYFDGRRYAAFEWLGHPSPALDGETPLERAETPSGMQDVLDLVGRLEHGIPT